MPHKLIQIDLYILICQLGLHFATLTVVLQQKRYISNKNSDIGITISDCGGTGDTRSSFMSAAVVRQMTGSCD